MPHNLAQAQNSGAQAAAASQPAPSTMPAATGFSQGFDDGASGMPGQNVAFDYGGDHVPGESAT